MGRRRSLEEVSPVSDILFLHSQSFTPSLNIIPPGLDQSMDALPSSLVNRLPDILTPSNKIVCTKTISPHHPSFRLHLLGHSCMPLVLSAINYVISTTNLTHSILSRYQPDPTDGTNNVLFTPGHRSFYLSYIFYYGLSTTHKF